MNAGEKARHAQTSKLRTTSTCADALTLASWTAAAFSLALCTPPFEKAANTVLMIGPLVIAPAEYSLAPMLASAAVTLVIGACAARRRSAGTTPCARDKTESATARRKTHREPTAPAVHRDEFDRAIHREAHDKLAASARKEGLSRTARWIGNGLAACAIAAALATSGLFCLISKPYTADPPSYAGDRVVVVERNVLLSGYGTVYYVCRGISLVSRSRWRLMTATAHVSNETYTLSWRNRTPTFEAREPPPTPGACMRQKGKEDERPLAIPTLAREGSARDLYLAQCAKLGTRVTSRHPRNEPRRTPSKEECRSR